MWKAFPYRDVFMFWGFFLGFFGVGGGGGGWGLFFRATFYFCLVVLIGIEDFTTPGRVTIYMTQLLGCYHA